jgi:hypothetical protein
MNLRRMIHRHKHEDMRVKQSRLEVFGEVETHETFSSYVLEL